MTAIFRLSMLSFGVILLGCGGSPAPVMAPPSVPSAAAADPAPDSAPVDVKLSRLSVLALADAYVGQRIHSYGAFQMMRPMMTDLPTKYRTGWLGVILFAAEPQGPCDPTKLIGIGEVSLVAPIAIGSDWADASLGSIFEFTGVVRRTDGKTGGGAITGLVIEVESMKEIGACQQGPSSPNP